MKKLLFIFLLIVALPRNCYCQTINQYRYWFDTNYVNAVTQTIVSPNSSYNLAANIPVVGLSHGYHNINIVFEDNSNKWSVPISSVFYVGEGGLTGYEYWFDNDYANKVSQLLSTPDSVTFININVNTNGLSGNYHVLNMRTQNQAGIWSAATSALFNKTGSITAYKCWINSDYANAFTFHLSAPQTILDVSSINYPGGFQLGKDTIYLQFQNNFGQWSSVIVDTFRGNTVTAFNYPSIILNKSTLDTGQTLTISGSNFTPSLFALISISAASGSQVVSLYVPINNDGTINFNWHVPDTLIAGTYSISANDTFRNYNTMPKIFIINNPPQTQSTNYLTILSPLSINQYYVGDNVSIHWSDKMTTHQFNTSVGGYSQRTYKIEYAINGGAWQSIGTYLEQGILNNFATFIQSFSPTTNGSYQLRISDANNLSYFRTSESFNILASTGGGINDSLLWDYSKTPHQKGNPTGVCADGTARVYIKITKKPGNNKTIASVNVNLIDPALSSSEQRLIGKLMITSAGNDRIYSTEANNASTTILNSNAPINNGEYWFWYVAPDDFDRGLTPDIDQYAGQRIVNAQITVTYSDNSVEPMVVCPIEIVRPPLMLVHGLGGSEHTWDNFHYTDQNSSNQFFINSNSLFKAGVHANTMYNDAYFNNNASLLLGMSSDGYANSFQWYIANAYLSLHACNRVDYVCHSMGGSMIRTVINQFPQYYANDISYTVRNYGKGFVNKLITINTPHDGTPTADIAQHITPVLNTTIGSAFLNGIHILDPDFLSSFFTQEPSGYTTSGAVNDLAAVNGGIRFNTTSVKNHLIAGLTSSNPNDEGSILYDYASNSLAYEFLKLFFDLYSDVDLDDVTNITSGLSPILINSITTQYGAEYNHWLVSSDLVVPTFTSQLAGIDPNVNNTVTILYGLDKWHKNITDVDITGNTVLQLLNSPINDNNIFADNIPANNNPGGTRYKATNFIDSTHEYVDTAYIKIIAPIENSLINVDSLLNISIALKDTLNLDKILLYFQGEIYTSYSKVANQVFSMVVKPAFIDTQSILVTALYDSSGFRIYHYNTIKVIVQTDNNLINNSIKFRKQYVRPIINIEASIVSSKEKTARNLSQSLTYHKIQLTDNGIGFESEYANRIFQVFQRLHGKSEYPGSGIGLSICKKIVEHHHGQIFAENIPGCGARFTFILPEQQAAS